MNTERKGWVCPKCDRVYSPDVQECQPCSQSEKVDFWFYQNPPSFTYPWRFPGGTIARAGYPQ